MNFSKTVLLIIWFVEFVCGEIIVETSTGAVQGYLRKSYKGRSYAAFEGIPYAKPPVGDLRFKPPQPIEKWEDTVLANTSYTCVQYLPIRPFQGVRGTEDCLYLYVYVPSETVDPTENRDVVVHIHGGAFMIGAPKWMADAQYMMDQNVIYVTFNYRLNVLGFLSTGDDVVSGNNGLKDQSMALKWIKDNIQYFGGNPDSITITGLSAGGVSVHYHYLSKLSHGLFHRGLSQSGTALQTWGLTTKPLKNAKSIANRVECDSDSNQEMVDCLRRLPADKVVAAVKEMFVLIDFVPYAPFGPVIETQPDGFITEHPYKLLKDKNVYDVPWINTNVKDEGILPAGVFLLYKEMENLNANWTELGPYCLNIQDIVEDPQKKTEIVNKVREYYFEDEPIGKQNIYTLVKLLSDRLFFADSETALRLHAQAITSPVYYYSFSYILKQSFFFPMAPGTAHSDDARLIYHLLLAPEKLSSTDEVMMELLTKFVADYAKTGIPKIGDIEWSPVTPDAKQIDYLHINGPDDIQMETKDELAPQEFWKSLNLPENEALFD